MNTSLHHPQQIDFAIIGAQKSATTAIQTFLNAHPDVYLPLGELACFESPDFEQGRTSRQIDFSAATPGQLHGLKRPTMFTDILAVNRLRDHSPSCKLIMVCREPTSRYVSAYFHLMNSGKLPVMDINAATDRMFRGDYLSRHAAGTSLLRNGIYHDALSHISHVHGPDCLFVTHQEALRSRYGEVMKELCAFLGIPSSSLPPGRTRDANVGSYDYRRARFRKISNQFIYSYSLGRTRKEYRRSNAARLTGRALSSLFGKWPFSAPLEAKQLLSPDSMALLKTYYQDDHRKLRRDFPDAVYW